MLPRMIVAIAVFVLIAAFQQCPDHTLLAGELSVSDSGYIDAAKVRTQFRLRYDAASDSPFPDRAEFIYPRCGCFTGGNGPGPPLPEASIDYQEVHAYFEAELTPGVSVFTNIPVRFINPVVNADESGIGDIQAGFRYSVIDGPEGLVTFMLRGYFPTGEGERGLGTEHVSLEPGILFQRDFRRSRVFGELKVWVPVDGSSGTGTTPDPFAGQDYAGSIVRYGLGHSTDLYHCVQVGDRVVNRRLSLVSEVVGWSVAGGLKTSLAGITTSATGETIINLKVGLRWSTTWNSVYIGYGRALTDEVWYDNILRVEYGVRF